MRPEPSEADRALSRRRTGDRSIILLIIGCLLLAPPVANIFLLDWRILGIPFTGLYLFVVWGGLIAGTVILSKRLQQHADRENQDRTPADDSADKSD